MAKSGTAGKSVRERIDDAKRKFAEQKASTPPAVTQADNANPSPSEVPDEPQNQIADQHSQVVTAFEPLRIDDVTVGEENDLGLREVEVRYGGETFEVEVDCHSDDALVELTENIARDLHVPVEVMDSLPQLIRERLANKHNEKFENANNLVAALEARTGENVGEAVKEALGNPQILEALAYLSRHPSGQFELALTKLEAAGMKPKQIGQIKAAVKRVATRPTALPSAGNRPSGNGPAITYTATDDGFRADFPGDNGGSRMLCNFTAEIVEDIHEDDGSEVNRCFRITSKLGVQEHTFLLPAAEFASMKWPLTQMGANATIYAGGGGSDHVRAAIQLGSNNCIRRTIYKHVGWAKIGGEHVYLHTGGAIGQNGARSDVEVELHGELSRYHLPAPPDIEELKRCIRASLALRKLAPLHVTCCLEGATFRAAAGGDCDTSVWIAGQTGSGKSELTARYQQHFGADFERTSLPGNWQSTGNSLEAAAHAAKDALFVIDDFCPSGTSYDRAKYNATAERVIRAARNKAGKQRLTADGRLRTTKTPRCIVVSTGEDIPEGHSLRASLMIVELGSDDLDFDKLQKCQRLGAEGVYAKTMAGFVKHLACCYDSRMEEIPVRLAYFRELASESASHKRTPELVANLMVGVEYFLDFALNVEAITDAEHEALFNEAWEAIGNAANQQGDYLADADTAKRFVTLIESALHGGHAHLNLTRGGRPKPENVSQLLGWGRHDDLWRPSGKLIGWIDADGVYLDPGLAYEVASDMARNSSGIPVSQKTLAKRLRDAGLLATHGEERGRVLVRKSINHKRMEVLHFPIKTFLGDDPRNLAVDGTFVFEGDGPEPPRDDFEQDAEEHSHEHDVDEPELSVDDHEDDESVDDENE